MRLPFTGTAKAKREKGVGRGVGLGSSFVSSSVFCGYFNQVTVFFSIHEAGIGLPPWLD